jgi:hypothetical protein
MEKMQAVEMTGRIDDNQQLQLDGALPVFGPLRVKVIVLYPFPEDNGEIEEAEWLQFAAHNPAFDVLKESAEDIYSPGDGKPFHDEV